MPRVIAGEVACRFASRLHLHSQVVFRAHTATLRVTLPSYRSYLKVPISLSFFRRLYYILCHALLQKSCGSQTEHECCRSLLRADKGGSSTTYLHSCIPRNGAMQMAHLPSVCVLQGSGVLLGRIDGLVWYHSPIGCTLESILSSNPLTKSKRPSMLRTL